MPGETDITDMLRRVAAGDRDAVDSILPVVYDELRALAERHLRRERSDHTLQATALVHEAYMKLVDQRDTAWQNRAHFFAVAAQAMRRILVDHARRDGRLKRGGDRAKISLDDVPTVSARPELDLVALDEALTKLSLEQPEKARVVEMRFFAGLTSNEVASVLGVTKRTVVRHWTYARAWLYREMTGNGGAAR